MKSIKAGRLRRVTGAICLKCHMELPLAPPCRFTALERHTLAYLVKPWYKYLCVYLQAVTEGDNSWLSSWLGNGIDPFLVS